MMINDEFDDIQKDEKMTRKNKKQKWLNKYSEIVISNSLKLGQIKVKHAGNVGRVHLSTQDDSFSIKQHHNSMGFH